MLLAACGKKAKTIDVGVPDTKKSDRFNIAVASFQPLVGVDRRIAFAVFADDSPIKGVNEVEVAFSSAATPDYSQKVKATLHTDGIEERPYFSTRVPLDRPGSWTMRVFHDGKTGDAAFQVFDPAEVKVPVPGTSMISTPTPTPTDHRGVEPICTREPPCSFHDVSLDTALTQGQPLAVLFGTPAFCESRTCGPTLDILVAEAASFSDKVTFIHVEIYKAKPPELAPAVKAYDLPSEPFLFLVGRDGKVVDRIDGAFDRVEARAYLQKLS